MPIRRSDLVDTTTPGLYHCISRCVRHAFLMWDDPDPACAQQRRNWVFDRAKELAGQFAIEIYAIAILGNHLHLLLRIRPDLVTEMSDDAVVRAWLAIYPQRNLDGELIPVTSEFVQELAGNVDYVASLRPRLCSLGEFHRCLKEPVARRANKEDGVTGHFWSARFKSKRILDETALITCMAYIDLNPLRAGIAKTPETSTHTSISERIRVRQARRYGLPPDSTGRTPTTDEDGLWLASFNDPDGPLAGIITLEQYLQLVDWTARQFRPGKRRMQDDLPSILDRLNMSRGEWIDLLDALDRGIGSVLATAASELAEAARRGVRRVGNVLRSIKGVRASGHDVPDYNSNTAAMWPLPRPPTP